MKTKPAALVALAAATIITTTVAALTATAATAATTAITYNGGKYVTTDQAEQLLFDSDWAKNNKPSIEDTSCRGMYSSKPQHNIDGETLYKKFVCSAEYGQLINGAPGTCTFRVTVSTTSDPTKINTLASTKPICEIDYSD